MDCLLNKLSATSSKIKFEHRASSGSFTFPSVFIAILNSSEYHISYLLGNEYDASGLNEEVVEIKHLINFNYSLKKPIIVKIKRNGDEYIGDIPELEIYSFGSDKFEVLRNINEEITELFEMLIKINDDKLGKHPKNWKKTLNEFVSFNEN
ncbi:MAG: hypothetical protein WAV76_07265 [Bacteroidota bacterium]